MDPEVKAFREFCVVDVGIQPVTTLQGGNRQVQEAIAEVFLQFRRLGSVRQVLLWYRQEKVPLCSYRRDAHGRKCFGPCRVTTASWRF